jgi:ATP-dependent DNA helicase RecQ
VLKGETAVLLREEPSRRERAGRRGSGRGTASVGTAGKNGVKGAVANPGLLASLKAWRSETARQRGVPAYVVLHDATIEGIAASRPQAGYARGCLPSHN